MFGTVHDLGELPGIAELAASVGAREPTAEAATALSHAIESSDLPLEGVLGVGNTVRSLIAWLLGRRLVRELPLVTVPISWFECHVPHRGSVRMTIEQSQQKTHAVAIKVFGSGYGRGRQFGLKVTQEFGRRTTCTDYIVDVRAIPMVYTYDGAESIVLNVVEEAGLRVVANNACARCSEVPDQLDPVEYSLGEYIDLRADDVDTRWKTEVCWGRARKLNASVSIPRINAVVGVEGTVTSELVWKLSYVLRSGVLYQPYYRSSEVDLLPPMWAFYSR
jgi:hypothetical protein